MSENNKWHWQGGRLVHTGIGISLNIDEAYSCIPADPEIKEACVGGPKPVLMPYSRKYDKLAELKGASDE